MKWRSETTWHGRLGDAYCLITPYVDGSWLAFASAGGEPAARIATGVTVGHAFIACERYAAAYAFVVFLASLGRAIETRDRCDSCARHGCYASNCAGALESRSV